MKKLLSIVTLACFMISCVLGDVLQAAAGITGETSRFKQVIEDFSLPQSYGRITDLNLRPGRQIVVSIQDLHCHPEVQRNIANILSVLDARYGLKDVYVEGGYGDINTSRLSNIQDKGLRKEIIENLLSEGRLTGSEYYSIISSRPNLLKGLEDEAIHKANIVRLGKILERKEAVAQTIQKCDNDLADIQAKYFTSRNKEFATLIEKYRAGKITSTKYYQRLSRYIETINRDPDTYNTIITISREDYPNVNTYMELTRQSRQLNYKKVSRQLQAFIQVLKARLPFQAYNALLTKTDNFSRTDELYTCLAALAREYRLDLSAGFPDLQQFFDYTEKSQALNPLALLQEERQLTGEIRQGLSRSISELEVSFLTDFYGYFKDYVQTRLTVEDYEYVNARFEKFRTLWGKYAPADRLPGLADDFTLLNEFYRSNCQRNACFLKNVPLAAGTVAASAATGEQSGREVRDALERSEIIVLVTGGFHTEGVKELLKGRNISYLTITPNVTKDTAVSDKRYEQFAREQALILSQAMQLGLASQFSSPALFELAIKAANRKLAEAGMTDRQELVQEIEDSMGIKVAFDPKSGIITFDNGSQIQLNVHKGRLEAQGIRASDMVSQAVTASLQSLTNVKEVSEALARASLGEINVLMLIAAKVAAEHQLLVSEGITDEAGPVQQHTLKGIQKEVLSWLPEPVITALAKHQETEAVLDNAAQRAEWLKSLLAIDLLRDFITAQTNNRAPATMKTSRVLRKWFGRSFIADAFDELFIAPFRELSRFTSLLAAFRADRNTYKKELHIFFREHGYNDANYLLFNNGITAVMKTAARANFLGIDLSKAALVWGHFLYNLKDRKRVAEAARSGMTAVPVPASLDSRDIGNYVPEEARQFLDSLKNNPDDREHDLQWMIKDLEAALEEKEDDEARRCYRILLYSGNTYPEETAKLLAAALEDRLQNEGDVQDADEWLAYLIGSIGSQSPEPVISAFENLQNAFTEETEDVTHRFSPLFQYFAEDNPQQAYQLLIPFLKSDNRTLRIWAENLLIAVDNKFPDTLFSAFEQYAEGKDTSELNFFTRYLGIKSDFAYKAVEFYFEIMKDRRQELGPVIAALQDKSLTAAKTAKDFLIEICELGKDYSDFPQMLFGSLGKEDFRVVRSAEEILITMYYFNPDLPVPAGRMRIQRALQLLNGSTDEIKNSDVHLLNDLAKYCGPSISIQAKAVLARFKPGAVQQAQGRPAAAKDQSSLASQQTVAAAHARKDAAVQKPADKIENKEIPLEYKTWLSKLTQMIDNDRTQAAKKGRANPLIRLAIIGHPDWAEKYTRTIEGSSAPQDVHRATVIRAILQEIEKERTAQEQEEQQLQQQALIKEQIEKATSELAAFFAARAQEKKAQQEKKHKKQDKNKQPQQADQAEKDKLVTPLAELFRAHPRLFLETAVAHKGDDKTYRQLVSIIAANASQINDEAAYLPFLTELYTAEKEAVQKLYRNKGNLQSNQAFRKALRDLVFSLPETDFDMLFDYVKEEKDFVAETMDDDVLAQLLSCGDRMLETAGNDQATRKFKTLCLPLTSNVVSKDAVKFKRLLSDFADDLSFETQRSFSFNVLCAALDSDDDLLLRLCEQGNLKKTASTAGKALRAFDRMNAYQSTKASFRRNLAKVITACMTPPADITEENARKTAVFAYTIANGLVQNAHDESDNAFSEQQLLNTIRNAGILREGDQAIAFYQALLAGLFTVNPDAFKKLYQNQDSLQKNPSLRKALFGFITRTPAPEADMLPGAEKCFLVEPTGDMFMQLMSLGDTIFEMSDGKNKKGNAQKLEAAYLAMMQRIISKDKDGSLLCRLIEQESRDTQEVFAETVSQFYLRLGVTENIPDSMILAMRNNIAIVVNASKDIILKYRTTAIPDEKDAKIVAFTRNITPLMMEKGLLFESVFTFEEEFNAYRTSNEQQLLDSLKDGKTSSKERLAIAYHLSSIWANALSRKSATVADHIEKIQRLTRGSTDPEFNVMLFKALLLAPFADRGARQFREEINKAFIDELQNIMDNIAPTGKTGEGKTVIDEQKQAEMLLMVCAFPDPTANWRILMMFLNAPLPVTSLDFLPKDYDFTLTEPREITLKKMYSAARAMSQSSLTQEVAFNRELASDLTWLLSLNEQDRVQVCKAVLKPAISDKPGEAIQGLPEGELLEHYRDVMPELRKKYGSKEESLTMDKIPAADTPQAVLELTVAGKSLEWIAQRIGFIPAIAAGGIIHWTMNLFDRPQLHAGTVSHVIRHENLHRNITKYASDTTYTHAWFTGLPKKTPAGLMPLGFRVYEEGMAQPIDVLAGIIEGSPVFYFDLKKAGIDEAASDRAVSQGAAQIMRMLGGTDTAEADTTLREQILSMARTADSANRFDFTPVMAVDHTGDADRLKRTFSDNGINKALIVPSDLFARSKNISATIQKKLAKRSALSVTMAEYKILEMDIASIDEFQEALDIFNAVGKGQMLVEWSVFESALQNKKITRDALNQLLKTAKSSGVAVYCKHTGDDETTFTDMGFAGVISPDKMVEVQLNTLASRSFGPDEVLDIRIPPSMTKDEIRESFSKLSLANTMVFHSVDASKLISTRDIEENKAFTALLDMLLNFGKAEITTPAKARRLGFNWDLVAAPVENRSLAALTAGQFSGSGIARDSALYEQAMELAPELRPYFLKAIAAKMLIMNTLAQKDETLSLAYARGGFRFSIPVREEMLGEALVRRFAMAPEQVKQDEAAWEEIRKAASDNTDQLLSKMYGGMAPERSQEGSITAVIDIILSDVFADYTMKKSMKRKQGTIDIRKVNKILSAA